MKAGAFVSIAVLDPSYAVLCHFYFKYERPLSQVEISKIIIIIFLRFYFILKVLSL